jgi:hypothetical protein
VGARALDSIRLIRCGDVEMGISVVLLVLTIALLTFRREATAAWNQFSSNAPAKQAIGLLVLLLLLITLEPETRAFLMVVDWIGADVFLLLLFFQGREMLVWSGRALWQPALRFLEVWSWFPMPLPSFALLRRHPLWSIFAVAQAGVTLMGMVVVAEVAVAISRALTA